MKPLIYIYADESCLGVQFKDRASPGGAGGMMAHWSDDRWGRKDYWISEPSTTNNRMAIRSAIEGLRALTRPCRVVFVSDSIYLVKGMSEWIHGWIRRGWKRKRGKIENLELWQQLARESGRHEIEWRWVKGHAGHPQNEYANFLATRAAKEQTSSGGPVPSGFSDWLNEQRDRHERYFDFFEFAPPEDDGFQPAPSLPDAT